MKSKYYRGKFMIAVYSLLNEGETLLALCDNSQEFAHFLRCSVDAAAMSLSQLYRGLTKYIKINGKIRTVEFIKVEE